MLAPAGLLLLALLALGGCATRTHSAAADTPPPAPREFRAVWVATVANIDWPSRAGLPVEEQRSEIIAILDHARALRLNAVILQVRPAADALYPSALEPWSEYLTGTQGRDPGYDPLAVWIAEAHRRGLELHAWFNPYRARHHEAKSPLAENHLEKTNPAVVKHYGELLWLDPGEPLAVARTLAVVRDVVRRYDVDGVHLDDYFYPYPIMTPDGSELDFPDEPSWTNYRAKGGRLARADWRRQNVDRLVEQLYRAVHAEKPWVKVGLSPFGIGRPDRRPPGIAGFSQYDKLYANVELWLARGWLDYLAPQLYWPRSRPAQDFAVLLDYWVGQNRKKRHLWPGLFASAINDTPKSWSTDEILRQIALVHAQPQAGGQVLFSMVALMQDRHGLATQLAAGPYAQPALVPATPWLGRNLPAAPTLEKTSATQATIRPAASASTALFAIWRRHGAQWHFTVQPAAEPEVDLAADPRFGSVDLLVVSAVDRLGNESPRVTLRLDHPDVSH